MNTIHQKGLQKLSALLDLELNYSHAKHNFELGVPLEGSLRRFFRPYFPLRYGFSSGYIVDADDRISNQTDWIIFDAMNFSPLLAQIHGIEGAEWFHHDSVYGCVEVKRTLTEAALNDAIEQLAVTRTLRREPTTLLHVTPYLRIPERMLNVAADAAFHEVCNALYTGIYAYVPGDFLDATDLLKKLEVAASVHGVENVPDFIAVHGHYYIRRAIFNDERQTVDINPFINQHNCFVKIDSGQMTAGVFYSDLMYQFANTLLSVNSNSVGLSSFLRGADLMKVAGKWRYA